MAKNIVIVGVQWGDEGKGKVVDLLTPYVQYVVRYQGGHNAGHTVLVNKKKVVLHVIPSGILHGHVVGLIGNGVVLSLDAFMTELECLKSENISLYKRVFISSLCPLVLPYHIRMDLAREKFHGLQNKSIGTTGCGIGPVYEDKVARRALRVCDLYDRKNLEVKLKFIMDYYNFQLVHYYHESSISYKMVFEKILFVSDFIINMIADIPKILSDARNRGESIIFEGAQGSLLDIDHGTYPYVTSSNTISGSASIGSGVGFMDIDYVLGVVKAYSTRVGHGPFPTELLDNIGDWLCIQGNEFGSTTGRRRRTGWFDAVAIRYAIRINSIRSCCLMKLDVLDGLKEIKVCVAYRKKNGQIIHYMPYIFEELESVMPVYETLPGWTEKTMGITEFKQLPQESQEYIRYIEKSIGVPVDIISTGPKRSNTIILHNPLK